MNFGQRRTGNVTETETDAMDTVTIGDSEIICKEIVPKCELMSKNALKLSCCEKFLAIPAGRELFIASINVRGDAVGVLVKNIEW
jgi:hypothetical protein